MAEAQGKDFGLIATEKGYNLYVCGNGGVRPRHADLLAADLDEETALQYLDRFLMYYIRTADRLTRTSVWLENLEGGIEYLRDVIVNDRLGIADELEEQMQGLVDSYQCEWKAVVDDPEKRRFFKQFANTDEATSGVEFVSERGQKHPADWPSDFVPIEQLGIRQPLERKDGSHEFGHIPAGSASGRSATSPATAAARSSTAMPRSPSTDSIPGASGTPARIPARTSSKPSSLAASSVIIKAFPKSPARCTRRRSRSRRGSA